MIIYLPPRLPPLVVVARDVGSEEKTSELNQSRPNFGSSTERAAEKWSRRRELADDLKPASKLEIVFEGKRLNRVPRHYELYEGTPHGAGVVHSSFIGQGPGRPKPKTG